MVRTVRHGCLLLAIGLALLSGCLGVTQNPSYFPFLLPTGDIIRTHAKPPGLGYFSNFDPHAVRLEVRPFEGTNPVRAQQVLIATIFDDKGEPRRHRRVEWMLEGVGNIIEVDESGYFPGRGYKVDNKYAVSYTDYCEHHITRGTADPNDDFVIRPGQTWCVISSAVEGDTHVTVYAPEVADWNRHKVFVTQHWVDAEWTLPPPAVSRVGADHVLTTNVFRHTDRQPLANYRVRYRVLDGPPAGFQPGRLPEAVAVSDLSGRASVALAQAAQQPGVNHIGIELIRPPDPTAPSGAGIIIGRGETSVEWQGPQVSLAVTGPPTAAVGQEVPFTVTVTNTGQVETQALTVHNAVPEGVQYVRSQPPANLDGNQLTWTLGTLPGGRASTLQVVFRSLRVGPVTNCASVTTVENLKADACATTQITAPQLNVSMTGPSSGVVGAPITYQITLANPGTGPATNVVLTDRFDPGLEHATKANPVELPAGTLGPGESRTFPLSLTPRQAGRLVNQVTATADGNLRAQAEHVVTVDVARLQVEITGPAVRYVERPVVYDIRVSNPGEAPLANVVVRAMLAPELAFVSATENGQPADGQIVWSVGALPAHGQHVVQVTARCLRTSPRAVTTALATADPGLSVRQEAVLEILGLPAFALDLKKEGDPVEVGGRVTYRIAVTNTGTLAGNQVEIIATVPPQLRVVNTGGPTQARVEGQRVIFPPVEALPPKQTLNYSIDVQALQVGDVRFRVELRSLMLKDPVIKEESTNIYDATAPPRPAPAPPTAAPPAGAAPPGAPAPAPSVPPPAATPPRQGAG
jgi:uncharacterized repeat protein (TIGR01451 family)